MFHLSTGLDLNTGLLLGLALLFVLFYEAINGFHDTANAVATVIYTRAMRTHLAVGMAGLFNFFGVLLGGLSVAYAIVHLLPIELLINVSSSKGLAMIFSLLLAAVVWNLSTWYIGLPASSSHSLIGSIIGVGLTNAFVNHTSVINALNIPKMIEIFLALLLSPLIGLVLAGGLIFLLRRYWSSSQKRARIHMTPAEREKINGKKKPPFWTRIALIVSAIGVSYSHGANDGQKGIGLIMLVLIGVAPAGFMLNMHASGYDIIRSRDAVNHLEQFYQQNPAVLSDLVLRAPLALPQPQKLPNALSGFYCSDKNIISVINQTQVLMADLKSYDQLTEMQRNHLRRLLMCISEITDNTLKLSKISADDARSLKKLKGDLLSTVEYAPVWIIVAVALALSLGTLVGWRRVAITIGEKIGKSGMTYAQGMAAQITAALSIGIASYTGMPVSTTHVLSSSVAGTMLVDGGGVQSKTVKNILLAWVLTLPACLVLSGILYWLALKLI